MRRCAGPVVAVTCVLIGFPSHLEDVPTDILPMNGEYQGRDHEARFNRLRQSPSPEWPTICVLRMANGCCRVQDGYHRLIVARERGELTIRAHVHGPWGKGTLLSSARKGQA